MSKKRTLPSRPPATVAVTARPRWAWALGLALLAVAVFWPATGFDYINFDDPLYVRDNPHVQGFSWSNLRWAFGTVHENWWLPLLWISYMLDTALFGAGPFGHHLVNLLLHATNAALLFWVLARLTKNPAASVVVAALFAVHPLRVEAVAWITARKDVLSGLFYMLALLAYVRHAEQPSARRFALVALGMALGLLSKAILITLPPVLLLLDYWPLRRAGDPLDRATWRAWGRLVLEKLSLILLAGAFVAVNWLTHSTGRGDNIQLSAGTRLGLIPTNYWAYVGKLLWPWPLAVVYPERDVVAPGLTVLAVLGLFLATLGLLRLRQRHPALLVGWLWFLVTLLPVIRGLRVGIAALADRFTYIPGIGLAVLLVWAAAEFTPPFRKRTAVFAGVAAAVLLACVAGVRAYLPLWRASEPLFRHALAVTDRNYVAAIHVAAALNDQGRTAEEIEMLRYAMQCHPPSAVAHTGLARALRDTAPAEAAAHLEQAIQFVLPREWDLHAIIGEQLALAGRIEEAARHFRQSLATHPDQPNTRLNLAAALLGLNQPVEALALADETLVGYPANDRALFSRGQALLALKRNQDAVAAFREARRLNPGKPEYASAWAMAQAAAGDPRAAVAELRALLRKNPRSPEILNNLAWLLSDPAHPEVADAATAIEYARQAAEWTDRKDPRILDTLAAAQAAAGQRDQAAATWREALIIARQAGATALADHISNQLLTLSPPESHAGPPE